MVNIVFIGNYFMLGFHYMAVMLSLAQNILELRSESPFAQDFARVMHVSNNASFCEIPVRSRRTEAVLSTLVSPEDYEKLVRIAPTWSVSSNGYVVTSKRESGKSKTIYMHKVVTEGVSARHVNGDRLDNRRSNLMNMRSWDVQAVGRTYKAPDVPSEASCVEVDYEDGKTYFGEMKGFRPDGFGTLIEEDKTSIGWWNKGRYQSGLVLFFNGDVSDRVRALQRPVSSALLIFNGTTIKTK